MAEEFDIMKPISADLDIGTTMFDEPKQGQPSVFTAAAASPQTDISAAQSVPVEKQYTPPDDDGVYNADYGYLTAQEADFISDISEDNDGAGVASSSGLFGPVSAAACSSDSPLEKAIAELESCTEGKAPASAAGVQQPENTPLQPYNDRKNIRAGSFTIRSGDSNSSGVDKAVTVFKIVSMIFRIIFVLIFVSVFFSVFRGF